MIQMLDKTFAEAVLQFIFKKNFLNEADANGKALVARFCTQRKLVSNKNLDVTNVDGGDTLQRTVQQC